MACYRLHIKNVVVHVNNIANWLVGQLKYWGYMTLGKASFQFGLDNRLIVRRLIRALYREATE